MTSWEDIRAALALRAPFEVTVPVEMRAAVALILREGNPGLELLFIHRAEHPADPWSGQMAFPGGRSEPRDAELRVTAIRETAEEIGVDLSQAAEPLGRLDEIQAMARGRALDLAITPFVFRLQRLVELRPNHEVRGVHWLQLDGLRGAEWRSTMEYTHQGQRLELPCIRADGRVIWGLTYRMFTNLERLLAAAAEDRASEAP
jgi:8-oxo-dGTP pyrophosphatase MutT (NUDIX family)